MLCIYYNYFFEKKLNKKIFEPIIFIFKIKIMIFIIFCIKIMIDIICVKRLLLQYSNLKVTACLLAEPKLGKFIKELSEDNL